MKTIYNLHRIKEFAEIAKFINRNKVKPKKPT